MAEFIRTLGSAVIGAREGSVLGKLELWSPYLIKTNTLFAEIANSFTITTFFETEKYRGVQVRCVILVRQQYFHLDKLTSPRL